MVQTTRPAEGAPELSAASPGSVRSGNGLRGLLVAGSSLVFATLQSLCTAFIALSGLRLVVGFSALASAVGARVPWRLHADGIRIPMVLLALFGALLNLYAIRRTRRLRNRPAAQWRLQPVSSQRLRSERLQISLAVLTLVLLAVEEAGHLILHHRL